MSFLFKLKRKDKRVDSGVIEEIGQPFQVSHVVHVGYNPATGNVEGLPEPWLKLLQHSNISAKEQSKHPTAVLQALKYYQHSIKNKNGVAKFLATKETVEQESKEIADTVPEISDDEGLDEPPEDKLAAEGSPADGDAKPTAVVPVASPVMRSKREETPRVSEEEVMAQLRNIVNPEDPRQRYNLMSKVGSGASGTVYTATDRVTQRKVAVKTMELSQQPKKELILTEIEVMRQNRHPNLVNFLDAYLVEADLWVVMEYLEGGALTDVVSETVMREEQMAAVCLEATRAIAFLHSQGIIHRWVDCAALLCEQSGLSSTDGCPSQKGHRGGGFERASLSLRATCNGGPALIVHLLSLGFVVGIGVPSETALQGHQVGQRAAGHGWGSEGDRLWLLCPNPARREAAHHGGHTLLDGT